MTGFEAYQVFMAMKLHFTTESYDYSKYNGKTTVTPSSFKKRKDAWRFKRMGKRFTKSELEMYLLANFMENKNVWIGSLRKEPYFNLLKKIEGLEYHFKKDVRALVERSEEKGVDFWTLFKYTNHEHPEVLKMLASEEISIETFMLIDRLVHCSEMYEHRMKNDILWREIKETMDLYQPFLTEDVKQYRSILSQAISEK